MRTEFGPKGELTPKDATPVAARAALMYIVNSMAEERQPGLLAP